MACPDGGTGRRVRLKIWFSQGSAGSIPVLGTVKNLKALIALAFRAFKFLRGRLGGFLGNGIIGRQCWNHTSFIIQRPFFFQCCIPGIPQTYSFLYVV
jgi:hypothetical protein